MDTQQKVQAARVQNLIRKVDLETASVKKWAVVKLLKWQPLARRIRFTRCSVSRCRSELMMSYQLAGETERTWIDNLGEWESCGYYCPSCGFGNAGGRLIDWKADK